MRQQWQREHCHGPRPACARSFVRNGRQRFGGRAHTHCGQDGGEGWRSVWVRRTRRGLGEREGGDDRGAGVGGEGGRCTKGEGESGEPAH